jgi:hypothetical protein
MTDDRLSDEQVSQLTGNGECFLHHHPDNQSAVSTKDKTDVTGMLKGAGGSVVAAVAHTDYQTPLIAGTDYQTPLIAGTDYQTPLVSGTNIKTLNGSSLLGSGNIVTSGYTLESSKHDVPDGSTVTTFANVIPAGCKIIDLYFYKLYSTSSGANIYVRFGCGSPPTIISSGYGVNGGAQLGVGLYPNTITYATVDASGFGTLDRLSLKPIGGTVEAEFGHIRLSRIRVGANDWWVELQTYARTGHTTNIASGMLFDFPGDITSVQVGTTLGTFYHYALPGNPPLTNFTIGYQL